MAMTIKSSFNVDATPAETWRVLTDIERSAPCFPGAELKSRNEDGSYKGALNVKLGPLTFKFAGTFGFVSQDEANAHAVIQASGMDVKGRGGAKASMDVQLTPTDRRTHVAVSANVDLSGSVAQYGRGAGMIEALSQQLVNQFAVNLQQMMSACGDAAAAAQPPSDGGALDSATANPAAVVSPQADAKRPAPAPAGAQLNAGALIWRALLDALTRQFRQWFGRQPG